MISNTSNRGNQKEIQRDKRQIRGSGTGITPNPSQFMMMMMMLMLIIITHLKRHIVGIIKCNKSIQNLSVWEERKQAEELPMMKSAGQ
jgi:hypothetical protein